MNMEKIKNFLKRFLGNNCEICTYENEVQAYNSSIRILVVEPRSENNYKYLLRVSATTSLNREANSSYIEKCLDTPEDVVDYLKNNELKIYKTLSNHLLENKLRDLNEAIKSDITNVENYHIRGIALWLLDRYEEAFIDLSKAIELDPTNAVYYSSRGTILDILKRHEEALIDYGKAIELDPTNVVYYRGRGITLYLLERYEEALIDFNKVIELEPTNARYYNARGSILQKLKFETSHQTIL